MNFWKEHATLRGVLIVLLFVIGMVLTVAGWKMTGKLEGLGLMLVGIILLLTALFVYNAPYRKEITIPSPCKRGRFVCKNKSILQGEVSYD